VARGDEEAFTGVCDQVAGAVYGLVIRIVADEAQAEQVAAEVLVEVWRSASRFSPATGSGLSWIMTIARRRAMRRAAAAGASHTASGSLLAHHGLASLPGPQREAVLLASSGYTRQRAADLAGVPADKVAEQLREGLLRLSGRPR
jgi:RNA polymerase sigma-70 factor (ECF subfamily)